MEKRMQCESFLELFTRLDQEKAHQSNTLPIPFGQLVPEVGISLINWLQSDRGAANLFIQIFIEHVLKEEYCRKKELSENELDCECRVLILDNMNGFPMRPFLQRLNEIYEEHEQLLNWCSLVQEAGEFEFYLNVLRIFKMQLPVMKKIRLVVIYAHDDFLAKLLDIITKTHWAFHIIVISYNFTREISNAQSIGFIPNVSHFRAHFVEKQNEENWSEDPKNVLPQDVITPLEDTGKMIIQRVYKNKISRVQIFA